MSITASILVLVVIALRLLLKKAPKALTCVLWGFVAIRLIFPISLESPFSLIPQSTVIPTELHTAVSTDTLPGESLPPEVFETQTAPTDNTLLSSGIPSDGSVTDTLQSMELSPAGESLLATEPALDSTTEPLAAQTPAVSVRTPLQTVARVASVLWPIGLLGMLLYAGISYLRIRKKVKEAVLLYDNIWLCDHVDTPFILGVFRPRILLPSVMDDTQMQHVIAHEKAHLKRLDHLWKPLGFILLSVYWFNPVLWIAYLFLCRDIELACDQKVIREMDTEDIKAYSSTLLAYSVPRKLISVCPLAFGEVSAKKRIKSALHYKKPAFWIIGLAVISCVVVAVCFLTDPKKSTKETADQALAKPTVFISFALSKTGSDIPGIQIKPEEPYAFFTGDDLENMSLPIQWKNQNYSNDFAYGESFDILYYENDTWNSCVKEPPRVPDILRLLPKKSTETEIYLLKNFDFSKEGLYRFQAEPTPGQYAWFDFETVIVHEDSSDSLTAPALLSILHAMLNDEDVLPWSDANNIIVANPDLYNLLLSGKDTTVDCFVQELINADDYGIREYLMALICSKLTGVGLEEGEYNPDTWWATGEQWLTIYQKHLLAQNEDMTTGDSSFTGQNVSLKQRLTTPVTPVTRSLVWLNYLYNREKNPGGILKVELPEFPGVVFQATSNRITAVTPAKTQVLISGNTLWTTYLADLNNDKFPDFCATVSIGEDDSNLGIVVYDYANQKQYVLQDSVQYDYALFGDTDSMYVRKTDRNQKTPDFVGELALVKNAENTTVSLQMTEVPSAIYSQSYLSDVHLDLIGYSNLYADLAIGENRWSSPSLSSICHIFTSEDWEAFTSSYRDVSVWTKDGVLSIADTFTDEINYYLESNQEEYHPAIFLSPHGLTCGVSLLKGATGFSSSIDKEITLSNLTVLAN